MFQKASIVVLVSCMFSACSHTSVSKPVDSNEETRTSKLTCSTPKSNSVTTQLYFGLSRQDAPDVSETEWNTFFTSILAPEFDGLTILSSQGAWLNTETNTVGRENSKLVIIVDEQDDDHLRSIDKVVENFVTSFDQQSVLINTFVSSPRFCEK